MLKKLLLATGRGGIGGYKLRNGSLRPFKSFWAIGPFDNLVKSMGSFSQNNT